VDHDQQVRLIQDRVDALEGMPVSDDQSAREAFTHVMVTVSRINEPSEAGSGDGTAATCVVPRSCGWRSCPGPAAGHLYVRRGGLERRCAALTFPDAQHGGELAGQVLAAAPGLTRLNSSGQDQGELFICM
jgi:hypothetical protein